MHIGKAIEVMLKRQKDVLGRIRSQKDDKGLAADLEELSATRVAVDCLELVKSYGFAVVSREGDLLLKNQKCRCPEKASPSIEPIEVINKNTGNGKIYFHKENTVVAVQVKNWIVQDTEYVKEKDDIRKYAQKLINRYKARSE